MSLFSLFMNKSGNVVHKWRHYFPAYERHLSKFKNQPLNFLEIGVNRGGSLEMWRDYFGPLANIVGIDIDQTVTCPDDPQIKVRFGDQSDTRFLSSLIDEFGVFDVVIDDGSHRMDHIPVTFNFLYPKLTSQGVYVVEDLHTCYWPEFSAGEPSFLERSKCLIDELNADHSRGSVPKTWFSSNTYSMTYYDSLLVFERGKVPVKDAPKRGNSNPSKKPSQ